MTDVVLGVVLSACTTLTSTADDGSVVPERLRCEYQCNPLGLDVAAPCLSWIVVSKDRAQRGSKQSANQILVAGSQQALQKD